MVEGDASLVRSYAGFLPADLVLVCGVFGNIGEGDIRGTVSRMPSFCAPGGTVVWTRHRRPPDLTSSVRGWFFDAGFEEVSFVAPPGTVLSVGCHRFEGRRFADGSADAAPGRWAVPESWIRIFGSSTSSGTVRCRRDERLFASQENYVVGHYARVTSQRSSNCGAKPRRSRWRRRFTER